MRVGATHREATSKLKELGFESLVVVKEPWGWVAWDENLTTRQVWLPSLKRTAGQVVAAVRRGEVPFMPPPVN